MFPKPDEKTLALMKRLNRRDLAVWLATWFGLGYLKPAPGTWGSLGALPFSCVIVHFYGVEGLALATLILFGLGLWATARFEFLSQEKDSRMIVIDEVVGQWIAVTPALLAPHWIAVSFLLFRAFDIFKPWPIAAIDRDMKTPLGVMADDIAAGLAAAVCLILLQTGVRYAGFGL